MKNNLLVATILVATFIPLMLITQTLATVAAEGQEAFDQGKCATCHDVSSAGIEAKMKSEKMKGPDLTGIAAKRDKAWLTSYIKKVEKIDGKAHKAAFKGTDEELSALIDWLLEQK
jgi:mono/diheme cytochrome c family protein